MATVEPTTAKGRATRERIVGAATGLMVERGATATGLDDVRAAADVSKGQLYHYFAGKDELVDAVIERTVDRVLAGQPQLADLSSWAAIRSWMDDMVAEQERRHAVGGCPIGSLANELADQRVGARELLAAGYDRWEAPLRAGLEAMRRRGRLSRRADPRRLATATMASIQGGLLLTKTRRDPEQLRIALDAAYAHLRSAASG
jgi:AcrR family transcriptional regulator